MSDKIKEMLEDIDNKEYYYVGTNGCLYQDLTKEQLLLIKKYITNLQQKYNNSQITLAEEWKKRLEAEEKIKHLDNQIIMLKQQNNVIAEMGLNYKSRIEKAIEYINTHYLNANEPELLKILKGEDENER